MIKRFSRRDSLLRVKNISAAGQGSPHGGRYAGQRVKRLNGGVGAKG